LIVAGSIVLLALGLLLFVLGTRFRRPREASPT
jgi:hypothetical protein